MEKTLLKQVFDNLFTSGKVKNQFEFGNILGYGSGYVSTLMKSDKPLPQQAQYKLHEVLGVSKVWLVTNGEKDSMFGGSKIDLSKPLEETFGAGNRGGYRVGF